MLSLDKPLSFDGIAVFRDHADPNQFWYLPGPVQLGKRPNSRRAAFSFIKYKPAVAGSGVKGGGFAMFETTLQLTASLEGRIKAGVMAEPGVTAPRLSPVIFETGKVEAIALNLQGSGGTADAEPLPPGAFRAVEKILGATTPSLDGANRAAFSLTLSQEGATILQQAFEQGLAPIGVLYTFTYSGMRPALEVEITADLEVVFNHFSASLEAQYQWVRAGIDAAFESLKQTGAIKIKILNFTGADAQKEQEQWALDFFKNDLLAKWFEPTFTPGELKSGASDADALSEVASFAKEHLLPKQPEAGGGGGEEPQEEPQPEPQPEPEPGPAAEPERQLAVLTPTSQTPDPLPDGRSVSHVPSDSGNTETITVAGEGAVVRVNGTQRALNNGSFTVDVVGGAPAQAIEVDWPASTQVQTFNLFFDFDEPPPPPAFVVQPPSPLYRRYVARTPGGPPDDRFETASGIDDGSHGALPWTGPERGGDRLRAWLRTLPAPREVEIEAMASFETQPQPGSTTPILTGDDQEEHNMRLSRRRGDVAVALIARENGTILTRRDRGHEEGRNNPNNPPTGDPNERVVRVRGRVPGGTPSQWRGTIERGQATNPDPVDPVDPPDPVKPKPKPPEPKKPQPQASNSMPGVVSFKLKFVRQEERKKLTFHYNRAEAVTRTYAPQGFFGLLLRDLADKSSYFTEVDLDDPFFRELKVMAEAPVDFERIGLSSAQVSLDYGDKANPREHKHGDFVFRTDDKGPKEFTVFLNSKREVDYAHTRQFHFSPDSGWDSDKFSVEIPSERTEDRTLFVNPYDVFDFLEFSVQPGDIDDGVIDSIEATLEASGPGAFKRKKTFIVRPGSEPQTWKLRAPKSTPEAPRTVTYALTHFLKDGTKKATPPQELTASLLLVHDPFPQSLNIELIPLWNPELVRQVFVDLEYTDPANNYVRNARIEIKGSDNVENVKARLAILDPTRREFRVRFSVVGTGGDFTSHPWKTTSEELVPVQV